jgi:hypothetical protein
VQRGPATASLTALAVAGVAAACDFQAPTRADFTRDVPLVGGNTLSEAVAWRATSFVLHRPTGLANFQALLDDALASDNMNFLIAETGTSTDFTAFQWPLQIGNGDTAAPGQYQLSPRYPPAADLVTVASAGDRKALASASSLHFTLAARTITLVPIPLTSAQVIADVSADLQRLEAGTLRAVIQFEEASNALLDLQNDGDMSNDTPLSEFLDPSAADADQDGDGRADDWQFEADFASQRAQLVE